MGGLGIVRFFIILIGCLGVCSTAFSDDNQREVIVKEWNSLVSTADQYFDPSISNKKKQDLFINLMKGLARIEESYLSTFESETKDAKPASQRINKVEEDFVNDMAQVVGEKKKINRIQKILFDPEVSFWVQYLATFKYRKRIIFGLTAASVGIMTFAWSWSTVIFYGSPAFDWMPICSDLLKPLGSIGSLIPFLLSVLPLVGTTAIDLYSSQNYRPFGEEPLYLQIWKKAFARE
ncbi:MAG: hypothetical protein AB7F43_07555 [Bacteriovoracia bacterium]